MGLGIVVVVVVVVVVVGLSVTRALDTKVSSLGWPKTAFSL